MLDKHTKFHFVAILSVVVLTSFQGCHPGKHVPLKETVKITR